MIHQYKLGGYNVVLDVCSGAVHVVDEIAYDMIGLFEAFDREEVLAKIAEQYPTAAQNDLTECYEQIVGLKQSGKLVQITVVKKVSKKLDRLDCTLIHIQGDLERAAAPKRRCLMI